MVFTRAACNPFARRGWAAAVADFLVSSMADSSDLRRAVVVVHVIVRLVAASRTFSLVFFQRSRSGIPGDDGGRSRCAAGAHGHQELTAGEGGRGRGPGCLLPLKIIDF